jgi:hypothetical protein
MGAPVQRAHTDLPLQTLDLLAECGLGNVLTGRGPAKMELLGECYEKPELTEFHPFVDGAGFSMPARPVCLAPRSRQVRAKTQVPAHLRPLPPR